MTSAIIQVDRIRAELQPQRIGRCIEHVDSTSSTNDEAWRRIDTDAADGLVIFAEHQSAGRGRLGRTWDSPRGASLLCSVIMVNGCGDVTGGELGLIAAVAACDAIAACTDVSPMIKWPNDLIASGRKLGGVLIESRRRRDGVRMYVLGIGINCLQQRGHLGTRLGDLATSLELESAHAVDRNALAIYLLRELDRRLAGPGCRDGGQLRREWLARAEPIGQRISLRHAGRVYEGSVVDLDPSAALVVRLDEGGVRLFDAATTTVAARGSDGESVRRPGRVC